MSAAQGKPGTGWRVVDQVPEIQVGPNNSPTEGVRVHFQTQYGVGGSVWLRRLDYTEDNVRTAITESATTIDNVHTLTG